MFTLYEIPTIEARARIAGNTVLETACRRIREGRARPIDFETARRAFNSAAKEL